MYRKRWVGHGRAVLSAGLLLLLIGGLTVQSADAQERDTRNDFWIGGGITGVVFLSDIDVPDEYSDVLEATRFSDTFGLGIEAGQRLSERWAVEGHILSAFNTDLQLITTGRQVLTFNKSIASIGVSGLYYPLGYTSVEPFLLAGGGIRTTDLETLTGGNVNFDPSASIGGGISAPVTNDFSVRFALRDIISWYNEIPEFATTVQHDLYMSAGAYLRL